MSTLVCSTCFSLYITYQTGIVCTNACYSLSRKKGGGGGMKAFLTMAFVTPITLAPFPVAGLYYFTQLHPNWEEPVDSVVQINTLLTLNRHSTWCHWPPTLEWRCSVRPWILIHCCTNFLFSHPKLILKKSPTLLYQGLHSLFTNIPSFSPKQNAVLSKMLPQKKASKTSGILCDTQNNNTSRWYT